MVIIEKGGVVLVVAAHPDDEVLGCGGTVARLSREGGRIYTLILGEGVTSRDKRRNPELRKKDIASLKDQAKRAKEILGIKETFLYDFPDNRFDTVAILDIIKVIEDIKERVRPDVILTHYAEDLNIDHRIVYNAVITAARPLKDESVKVIYSFETPSSTEWSFPIRFSPDLFIDISKTIDIKLKAAAAYRDEMRRYPHPRSLEGLRVSAKYWGMKAGVGYAEALKTVRAVI